MQDCNYIYALSFDAGGDSGLALVSARNDMDAMQILKNGGRFNCTPDVYVLKSYKNIGLSSVFITQIILESYTNAQGVYEALVRYIDALKGDTPVFSIGSVETLPAGSQAYVYITGTPVRPVLNFGIPEGDGGLTTIDWGNISGDITKQTDLVTALNEIKTIANAKYTKPSTGIPKTDLDSAVQTSLGKADSAYQRPYDSENPNGLGYLVLEKDKTFADQVTEANTIYEVRYDYELDDDFTMPSGCILKFNGGSIRGAAIVGAATKIEASPYHIVSDISGSWCVDSFYPEWVGAVGDGSTDDTAAFTKLNGKPIKLLEKTYIVSNVVFGANTSIVGANIATSVIKQKNNSTGSLITLKDWNGGLLSNFSVVGGTGFTEKSTAYKIAGAVCSDALIKIVGTSYQGEGVGLTYYSTINDIRVYNAPCNGIVALAQVTDEGVSLSYNWVFSIENIWIMNSKYYGLAIKGASDNRFSHCYIHHSGYANIYDAGSVNIFENFKLDGEAGDGFSHDLIESGNEEASAAALLASSYSGALMIISSPTSQYRNFDLQSGAFVGLKCIGSSGAELTNVQFRGIISNCGIARGLQGASFAEVRLEYAPAIYLQYIINCDIEITLYAYTEQRRDIIIGSGVKGNKIRLQNRRYNQDYINKLPYSGDIILAGEDNDILVPDLSLSDKREDRIVHNLYANSNLTNHTPITTGGSWDNTNRLFNNYDQIVLDLTGGTALSASSSWGTGASKRGHLYLAGFICRCDRKSTKTPPTASPYLAYPYMSLNAMTSLSDQTPWDATIAKRSGDGSLLTTGEKFISAGVFKFDTSGMPDEFVGQFIVSTNKDYNDGIFTITDFFLYDLTEDLGITTILTSVERLVYNILADGGYEQLLQPLGDIHTKFYNGLNPIKPGDYMDKASMQDFLHVLGAAMGGVTWVYEYDQAAGKYVFDYRFPLAPTWTSNYMVVADGANTGQVAAASNISASNAIDISSYAGKTLYYTRPVMKSTTTQAGMCIYDANNVVLDNQRAVLGAAENGYELTQVAIPSNAATVRFSARTDLRGSFMAYVK